MTWQRIDENTYIDDTLVTCAEYQLFIDEMREQGKNYRPDHWTSYQFPKGQAQGPILGVRQWDALAFCEWLTNQKAGKWKFRLPSQKETDTYPVKHLGRNLLGYWLGDAYQFNWIEITPNNARDLDRDRYLARVLVRSLDRNIDFDYNSVRKLDRDRDRDAARDLVGDLARDHALNFARASAFVLDQAIDFAYDFANDRDTLRNLAHDLAPDIYTNLLLLQERVDGRLPAFEGIRLVRERVK